MGQRIKDRSWRLKELANTQYLLRLVEPNGDYLFFERYEDIRDSGFEPRPGSNLFKAVLNEDGNHSISLQKEDPEIFGAPWATAMDYRKSRLTNSFAENAWRDSYPLYSPTTIDEHRYFPRLSIDDGNYVLTQVEREGEEGEEEDGSDDIEGGRFLVVRPMNDSGKPVEIDLEWPRGFRRNGHAGTPRALGTLHSEDTYAIIFEGKRVINVFRQGNQLTLNLNFGKVYSPSHLKWSSDYSLGTAGTCSLWMGFTDNGSRLLTVSLLPYWNHWDDLYYSSERSTALEEAFRWEVKSWDIDGRVAEMARTKLRLEGKWKAESEREKRAKTLSSAGLPIHVARLISRHGLSDREGISIFNRLREGGVPSEGSTDNDPLKLIDEIVFSRRVPVEDGRFLVENRNHVDLVTAVADGSRTLEWARWLLLDRGFSDHPEATSRIIAGADVETVALVEGITSAPREEAAKQTEPAGTEESKEVAQDESPADTESRKPFWRRKSRFA